MSNTQNDENENEQEKVNKAKQDHHDSLVLPATGDPIYDQGPDPEFKAKQILRSIENIAPLDEEQRKDLDDMVTPRTVQPLNHEDQWDDWRDLARDPVQVQDMWKAIFGENIPLMTTYEMRAIIRSVNSRLLFTWDESSNSPCSTDCYDPLRSKYWRQGHDDRWRSYQVGQYTKKLFRIGRHNIKGPGGAPTEIQSDIEAVTERQVVVTEGMSGYQSGIHDVGDRLYDSAVLLKAKSFSSKGKRIAKADSIVRSEIDLKLKRFSDSYSANKDHSFSLKINFNSNESIILEKSFLELNQLVELLKEFQDLKLEIIGHTDDVGDANLNKKLSLARSKSVVVELKKLIPSSQFKWMEKGLGESKPLVENDSDENRSKNRRVEILVVPN